MLTWPTDADQFINAKLLVDELKVGIRVGEGTQYIPKWDELAWLLSESLKRDTPERKKAEELSKATVNVVDKGGSSDKDLDCFVTSVNELEIG